MSALSRQTPPSSPDATRPEPKSANGSAGGSPAAKSGRRANRRSTRIGSLNAGLVIAALALVLLVIFLVQNSRTVEVSFLGGHLRVSLAVAMLIASVAGALIVGATGMARIGQLRRKARQDAYPQ